MKTEQDQVQVSQSILPIPSTGRGKLSAGTYLLVAGLNYHGAPISIRERIVIPDSCLSHALQALKQLPHVKEAIMLSTCNRTEVYAVVTDIDAGRKEIDSFFQASRSIRDHGSLKLNFTLLNEDVALHLFRVASGLDSMIPGEGQIMAQVKSAKRAAQEAGTAGPLLNQVFELALECGKRVRRKLGITTGAVSASSAAAELARRITQGKPNRSVLIIGAGTTAKSCAKYLLGDQGNGSISMVNRSQKRVIDFAASNLPGRIKLNGPFSFDARHQLAAEADVVIVAVSAPEYVLTADELLKARPGKEICIIDLSVPRSVDPQIAHIEGIKVFHLDDVCQIINKNIKERRALIEDAESVVFEMLEVFNAWQRSVLVAPIIVSLRKKFEAIRIEQIEKSRPAIPESEIGSKYTLDQFSCKIVNQILHGPTIALKATTDHRLLGQHADSLRKLFNLREQH